MQIAHTGRSLHWTAWPHCVPAIWAALTKEFPELYFNQSDWNFPVQPELQLYPHQHPHGPVRAAPFWPIKTVPFGPRKKKKRLGFGTFIWMRTDQSGTRSSDFSLCKSAPFWFREGTFPFYQSLKTVSPTGAETLKMSCRTRVEKSTWSSAAQSRTV